MALEIIFWVAVGLIVYAHLGYPLLLWALVAIFGERDVTREPAGDFPTVSLIVPAHDEELVIEKKVANARTLDYPAAHLEIVVASDGSEDRTAELARAAGADRVLELPRGGKVAALNAAVAQATGDILAFSDANSYWRPDALRRLVGRFADQRAGYACGQVRFEEGEGGNQEGLYWRYEMAVRSMETRLAGIPTWSSTRAEDRTSASRSSSPNGGGAPSTSRPRSPRRRWPLRSRASSGASAG